MPRGVYIRKIKPIPPSQKTHGDSKRGYYRRLYTIWLGMRKRCLVSTNKDYHCYGGRGIGICPEWESYEEFKDWAISAGYLPSLSIDRTNNNLGYAPSNCRWVSLEVNNNNKRNNRLVTAFGETKTVTQWSRDSRCAVDSIILSYRIRRLTNLPPEQAITIPPRKTNDYYQSIHIQAI